MFYHNHNLKRAIGLMGVALALLSGVQQSHSFCYLAGCAPPAETVVAEANGLASACGCSCACNEEQTVSSGKMAPVASRGGSCPCPPTCWCHQPSEPWGLPTSTSGSAERLSQSVGQSFALVTAPASCDQGSTRSLETRIAGSIDGARLRCAELCRFLI